MSGLSPSSTIGEPGWSPSSSREPDLEVRLSVFRQGTRPPHNEMIHYIDERKDQFGVKAICRVLRPAVRGFITFRGYSAAKSRPPSARSLRNEPLAPEIARLHAEIYGVYGAGKIQALMRRHGWEIGRNQTLRLMKITDVREVKRSRRY